MPYEHKILPIEQIKLNPRNVRTHSTKQIRRIAASIDAMGFAAPVLIDEDYVLIAGEGRIRAARSLGLASVSAIVVAGLSDGKKRALMLADNQIALGASYDRERLVIELAALPEILVEDGLTLEVTGFEAAEIDALIEDFEESTGEPPDEIDHSCFGRRVTQDGDRWRLDKHSLLCGDARNRETLSALLGQERASMAFLDPPYNLPIRRLVGRGATKHREFAMASGEMTPEEFTAFLKEILGAAAEVSNPGAVHFICIDWRHVGELIAAGRSVYETIINLCVWVKTNAGQGSFYRSKHELIGVFKVGNAAHCNNVQLGRHGRNRSNVWEFAGGNSFRIGRMEDLRSHPTVKPTKMIADAIKDCTRRGEIVLDTFCGSGSTLLAAELVGRRGFGLEIDPAYVDLAIRRWQKLTGRDAIHCATGKTFEEVGWQGDKKSDPAHRAPAKTSAR